MNKEFSGFSEKQMEQVARRMGFTGPMDKFDEFVSSDPAKAAKLKTVTEKAASLLGSPKMASGGVVSGSSKKSVKATTTATSSPTEGDKLTKQALTDPQSLITEAPVSKVATTPQQLIPQGSGQMQAAKVDDAELASTQTATSTQQTPTNTVTTATSADKVNQATEGLQGAQGTVSQQGLVEAATAEPSTKATVQGQMSDLMKQFEGGETPAWAAGAMRKAETMMAQRGLGSSSMAGAAITQAAMESALNIAVQDANMFGQFEMQNLNNRQQARVLNAQAFLQMDLANLDNEQQALMYKTQARVQSLFNDAAAENASRQFNASSENQADQFFATLKTEVSKFNAAQKNATEMFNAENKNAFSMFKAEQDNMVAKFNAESRLVIDQSNAEWRRLVATTDNAQQNETNRLNAQMATDMTTAAYNNLWQKERDIMSYVFTASENAAERANNLVLAKMTGKNYKDAQEAANKNQMWQAAGNFVASVLNW